MIARALAVAGLAGAVPVLIAAQQPAAPDNAGRALALCQAHFAAQLSRPDGFRVVAASQQLGPATDLAGFDRDAGIEPPAEDDPRHELWQLQRVLWKHKRLALRVVTIDYAAPDLPAPARGQCGFREIDGALESNHAIRDHQEIAHGMATLNAVRRAKGGRTFGRAPRFTCCL